MAKRVGPNQRKKTAQRRRKARRSLLKTVALALTCLLVLGSAGIAWRAFEPRIADLARRIDVARDPAINHVVVKGSHQVLPDELLRKAGVTLPLSLDTLKNEYLAKLKAVHPWIGQVRLVRRQGTTATIEVRERRPIALLQSATVRLVDDQGVCLPLERGLVYDVPLVSGLRDSADGLWPADLARLTRFLAGSLRADAVFAGSISQLHFHSDGRVSILFSGVPTVVIMRDNDADEGFERLLQLWDMAAEGAYPRRIDLSYRTLAFVTPHGATRIAGAGDPKTPGKKG